VPESGFPGQLIKALRTWWQEQSREQGTFRALCLLAREIWGFVGDSTPEQQRRRFGDMEYDWEHRVNTTSGTVGWRERLLGTFLSAYQPTEPAAFREMMAVLPIDFRDYLFVDLGSGKGRTLLMASEYPFRRIIGVEILPSLHGAAEKNILDYRSPNQRCNTIEAICADARTFPLPPEPLVLYLFNPLPTDGLDQVLANLESSLRETPRPALVVYHNPVLGEKIQRLAWLQEVKRTEQYAIFCHRPD
jgi:SAM-dependent methyltransferase